MANINIFPAGWALRHFMLDELNGLLRAYTPRLIEISKDFLRNEISIKTLARDLISLKEDHHVDIAFAGTTDLVGCAGFPWEHYKRYLSIQFDQARFLECSLFRILVGRAASGMSKEEIIRRIELICWDLAPITICIEIHSGVECDLTVLDQLMKRTTAKIVIDIENMRRAELKMENLLCVIPLDRIAYVHQRNLSNVWVENAALTHDEKRWHVLIPHGIFLWEPKSIDNPHRIQELFLEYKSSY
jgi:hypothetical protein